MKVRTGDAACRSKPESSAKGKLPCRARFVEFWGFEQETAYYSRVTAKVSGPAGPQQERIFQVSRDWQSQHSMRKKNIRRWLREMRGNNHHTQARLCIVGQGSMAQRSRTNHSATFASSSLKAGRLSYSNAK